MNLFRIPCSVTRNPRYGFTLIEIMVATVILSLGAVLVHEAFFLFLDTYSYCTNYLNVVCWQDEKIWQTQDDLNRLGTLEAIQTNGEFIKRNKDFAWNLSYGAIDATQGLYKIDLVVFWQEGQRGVRLSRSAYVMYEDREGEPGEDE